MIRSMPASGVPGGALRWLKKKRWRNEQENIGQGTDEYRGKEPTMNVSSSSDAGAESADRDPRSGNTPSFVRPFHIRGFASLLLLVSFPVLALSGVVLYVSPRGRFANWNAWTMLGLRRDQWSAIHVNLSLLFLVIALLHLLINWRAVIAYVRRRRVAGLYLKSELVCALALLAALLASTLANVLPFQAVIDVRYRIRNSWERPTETIEPVMRETSGPSAAAPG
jgi:hypothetical protein